MWWLLITSIQCITSCHDKSNAFDPDIMRVRNVCILAKMQFYYFNRGEENTFFLGRNF